MSAPSTSSELTAWLRETPAAVVYFESRECGICRVLRPKIEKMLQEHFPRMRLAAIDAGEASEAAAHAGVFSFPAVLVYFEGKEFLRRAGVFSLAEFARELERPYQDVEKGFPTLFQRAESGTCPDSASSESITCVIDSKAGHPCPAPAGCFATACYALWREAAR